MRKTIIQLSIIVSILSFYHSVHAQSLLINEVMHSNIDGIMDDLNEFPDSWVEIYNADSIEIDITNYSIGKTANYAESWPLFDNVIIQAKGYYLIYCDKKEQHNHTNFRIETEDFSELFLFDPEGNIIEYVQLPPMISPNISYGRIYDGCDTFSYFKYATPLKKNEGFYTNRLLEQPIFSIKGGIYTSPIELQISLQGNYPSDATIHYTTDGSEPTEESPIVPTSLYIEKTTIIRAKAFSDSALYKSSKTESYIFLNRETKLPIISIATDNSYLWDDEIGIYTKGTYGINHPDAISEIPEWGNTFNYLFSWRRPVNFEYYDKDQKINQICEINIGGNSSRAEHIKSFVLHANERFGKKNIKYAFWNAKPNVTKNKSIYLRNSGQDLYSTLLRDALIQLTMGNHVNIDWCAYQPAIILINGEYYGITNIRERHNEDYLLSNYNTKNIVLAETWITKEGPDIEFQKLNDIISNPNSSYEKIDSIIELDEFSNHLILNSIYANVDFPGNNNIKWLNLNDSIKKWRWILNDFDIAMGSSTTSYHAEDTFPYLNFILQKEPYLQLSTNDSKSCLIYKILFNNHEFRKNFIDKSTVYLATFESYKSVSQLIDSLSHNIEAEIPYFNTESKILLYKTYEEWQNEVEYLKYWYANRVPFFYHHLQDFFELGDTTSLVIESHKSKQLYFNDIKVENNRFNGKYYEKRHLYLSHEPNLFSYDADTFTASIDTVPTSSYWVVRYQLNDSIVHNTFHTNNLLYHIPQNAQNVYITDTLFVTWDTLPTITHVIDKPLCSISVNELISSPWAHDQLGNHYKGFLIDTLLSIGTNTIDWNVVSVIGDTLHYPQTIVLIDSSAPEIDCQQLTTIELSITTNQCVIDNAEVSFPIPTATDNCDITIDGTLSAPNEYYLGDNTIYWTFTDSAGNATQCSQNVTVVDRFAPYYDCQKLPDLSYELNTIICSIDSSEIQLSTPIATDNCETNIVGILSAPQEYPIGNNTIYWTFTDSAGNTSQCPQTIIVVDKAAPIVNCNYISPLTYNIFTSDCGINSQVLNIQTPYAFDNCGSIVEGNADIPDYFEIGDHSIDWHFTDIYGNESLCTQSITIADYYAPVVQPEAENIHYITLPLNANDIASDEIELPTLFATDNCNELIEGNVTLPTNFSIGDNILLWTFSDDYGNISYFQQNVYAIKQFELMIYPNPVDETLYISGVEPDEEIILYNMFGQRIYQTKSIGNPATIDMSQFTDNLYFILFRNQYYKIIKK